MPRRRRKRSLAQMFNHARQPCPKNPCYTRVNACFGARSLFKILSPSTSTGRPCLPSEANPSPYRFSLQEKPSSRAAPSFTDLEAHRACEAGARAV